jgi:hypothetical protein
MEHDELAPGLYGIGCCVAVQLVNHAFGHDDTPVHLPKQL